MKVFIIAALTADGFIGRDEKDISTGWTSKEDKAFFRERTKQAGVMIMGSKTFETIGKPLPGRTTIVYSRSGKTYPGAEVTDKEPQQLLQELESRGFAEVAICGGSSIYTLFAKSGCVDTLYVTIEPVLFGSGVRLFNETLDLSLSLSSSKQLGSGTLLLEYNINGGPH